MSVYIITGGAGMIGSNLVRRLVEQGESVILVDNFSRGRIDFLPNHIQQSGLLTIVELDLRYEEIPNKYLEACDYFVHLADIVGGIQYVFANQTSIFSDNLIINAKVISKGRYGRTREIALAIPPSSTSAANQLLKDGLGL